MATANYKQIYYAIQYDGTNAADIIAGIQAGWGEYGQSSDKVGYLSSDCSSLYVGLCPNNYEQAPTEVKTNDWLVSSYDANLSETNAGQFTVVSDADFTALYTTL